MDYPYRLNAKLHDTLFLQTKIHKHISHMRDFHGNIKMNMEGWKRRLLNDISSVNTPNIIN